LSDYSCGHCAALEDAVKRGFARLKNMGSTHIYSS